MIDITKTRKRFDHNFPERWDASKHYLWRQDKLGYLDCYGKYLSCCSSISEQTLHSDHACHSHLTFNSFAGRQQNFLLHPKMLMRAWPKMTVSVFSLFNLVHYTTAFTKTDKTTCPPHAKEPNREIDDCNWFMLMKLLALGLIDTVLALSIVLIFAVVNVVVVLVCCCWY